MKFQLNSRIPHNKLKTGGMKLLDDVIKPFLIIVNCLIGFIFEFLVELPFMVIIGFHHFFGKKSPKG